MQDNPILKKGEDDLVRHATGDAHLDEEDNQQNDDEWRTSRVDDPELDSFDGWRRWSPNTEQTAAHPCVIAILGSSCHSHESSSSSRSIVRKRRWITVLKQKNVRDEYRSVERLGEGQKMVDRGSRYRQRQSKFQRIQDT